MTARFVTVRRPRSASVWVTPFGTVPGESDLAAAMWQALRRVRLMAEQSVAPIRLFDYMDVMRTEMVDGMHGPLRDRFLAGWANGSVMKASDVDAFQRRAAERYAARQAAKVASATVDSSIASMDRTVGQMRGMGVPDWKIADHMASTIGLPDRYVFSGLNRFSAEWERLAVEQPTMSLTARSEAASATVKSAMDRATGAHVQTVSRTLAMQATNEGRLESWLDLDDAGMLAGNPLKRWRVADGDADEQCLGLEGTAIELQDFFDGQVLTPPIHANCRCEIELTVDGTGSSGRTEIFDPPMPDEFAPSLSVPQAGVENATTLYDQTGVTSDRSLRPKLRDDDQFGGSIRRLDRDQQKALSNYYENPGQINDPLRGVGFAKDMPVSTDVARIDAAIDRHPGLAQSTTTYRKTSIPGVDIKPGTEFTDLGYASTSASRTVASDFGGRMMEVRIPAGTKIGYVDTATELADDVIARSQELEVLLGRGTRFRVVGVNDQTGDTIVEVLNA